MNRKIALWLLGLLSAFSALAADAGRNLAVAAPPASRFALVIGNSAYPGAAALKNPANDASDIAGKLRKFNFNVTLKTNVGLRDMLRTLTEFGDKVQQGSEVLFFYAGHGMQVRGKNYLIPIDAEIRTENAVSSEAVDVDQLLDKLSAARLSMVILDACRNNPFERRFRGGGQGLASINAPTGTLIAYATAPGKVASDGEGRNGLYTQELLAAMDMPGNKVEDVFKRVRANVVRKSGEAQTPWESSSLTGDFYFVGGSGDTSPQQVASLGGQIVGGRTPAQIEDELWDAIKDTDKPSVLEEYLKQYPKGRYIAQAKIKLAGLKSEAQPTAVPPAPTPVAPAKAENPEDALWAAVEKGGSADDYDAYLGQYPKGKYVALAKQRKQKLQDAAAQEARQRHADTWTAAESGNSEDSYGAYLKAYPTGQYATLAQGRIRKLQADAGARAEQDAWKKAEAGTSHDITAYLNQYPAGRYAAAARLKLAQIEKEEAARPRAGTILKDCADCPEMVVIPAGSFEMGGSEATEKPVHTVRIARPFALGKTEITQGQWRAVMGTNPSDFKQCGDDCPVENISWDDAQEFVRKLSAKTGKSYRLPSEAEWEYACRAGGRHEYCGSDSIDSVAWYGAKVTPVGNSAKTTNPVGRKQANAWGLYDMSGNVWEWVEDCWNENYNGAPSDGSAWVSGHCSLRPLRAGSWNYFPQDARAASRRRGVPSNRYYGFGFRPARMLP